MTEPIDYAEIRGRYPGLPALEDHAAWKPTYKWAYEAQTAMLNPDQYDWPHLPWQIRIKIIDAIKYGKAAHDNMMSEADKKRAEFQQLSAPAVWIESKHPNGLFINWEKPVDWGPDSYTICVRDKGQEKWRSVCGEQDADQRREVITRGMLAWGEYREPYEVAVAAEKDGFGRHISEWLEYPPPPEPEPIQEPLPVEVPNKQITEEIPIVDPPPVIQESQELPRVKPPEPQTQIVEPPTPKREKKRRKRKRGRKWLRKNKRSKT